MVNIVLYLRFQVPMDYVVSMHYLQTCSCNMKINELTSTRLVEQKILLDTYQFIDDTNTYLLHEFSDSIFMHPPLLLNVSG